MWRRYGDAFYALLVLLIFTVEAAGLGLLSWVFLLGRAGITDEGPSPRFALLAALAATAVSLMIVTAYTLAYQALSASRERVRNAGLEHWNGVWADVVFRGATPPEAPLEAPAVDALLDLREALRGSPAAAIADLMSRYEIDRMLIERARGRRRGRQSSRRQLLGGPRGLADRLEALDALARARIPEAFDTLRSVAGDNDPAIRMMAMRALARSAAAITDDAERLNACDELVALLKEIRVPSGVVEEVLVLLEDAAPGVVRGLLGDPSSELLPVALDAAGRLKLIDLAPLVATYASHDSAEVRAPALRALGASGLLPPGAVEAVLRGVADPVEMVRIQAARALRLVDKGQAVPALWGLLGDPSWWVRRSAALSLSKLGDEGSDALRRASASHPDRFARHMSVQALLDSGRIDAEQARRLRGDPLVLA